MCDLRKPYFKKDDKEVPYWGHLGYTRSDQLKIKEVPEGYYYSFGCSGSGNYYVGNEDEIEWKQHEHNHH